MRAQKSRWSTLALLTLALATAGLAGVAEAQQPERRDTNPRLHPPEVKLSASVEPAAARPGDTVTYKVTATVTEPWHIYAYSAKQPVEGPRSTQFDLFDPADLEPVGSWTPDRDPKRAKEPAFPNLEAVEYYDGEVTWSIQLKIPADASPGTKTVKSQISFQICNDTACKPPVNITVPEVKIEVQGGDDQASLSPSPKNSQRAGPPDRPDSGPFTPRKSKGAAATRLASFLGASDLGRAATGLLLTAMMQDAPATAATEPAPAPPAAASSAPAEGPVNVQGAIDQGFLSFLLFSALGGLAALLMPCVWPLVPITVNFFIKQGQRKGGGSTTLLAIVYCLSIIVIFTAIGVLASAILGAGAANKIANNGPLNLFIALMFFAFGLSLLGLYEIRLPSFLLNASARNEGRGGLVGVIFMATTLVITSFTCTVPVVGGLLAIAAKGSYFYPVVGMLVFSTVLALPFFLMALMPGQLAKLPKSGDWMNSVKVVGGLVEIGAAFKFLNMAEIGFGTTPENAWFDSQVLLAAWVILAAICGLYLLGFFRTDHDHGEIRIGPGRMLTGAAFLFLAIYLAPALFGVPPKSKIYDRMVVGLLPGDAHELSQEREILTAFRTEMDDLFADGALLAQGPSDGSAAPSERLVPVKATSTDPEEAIRQERTLHGVLWGMSLDAAKERAKAENRPILVDFTGVNCANCRTMEQSVFPRKEIVALMKQFETVQLYVDLVPIDSISADDRFALAEENALLQLDMVNQSSQPYYVVIDPDGQILGEIAFTEVPNFKRFLETSLEKFRNGPASMAQTAAGR